MHWVTWLWTDLTVLVIEILLTGLYKRDTCSRLLVVRVRPARCSTISQSLMHGESQALMYIFLIKPRDRACSEVVLLLNLTLSLPKKVHFVLRWFIDTSRQEHHFSTRLRCPCNWATALWDAIVRQITKITTDRWKELHRKRAIWFMNIFGKTTNRKLLPGTDWK